MYKVVVAFTGVKAEDGASKVFKAGDLYPDPATNFKPKKRRIEYLLSRGTSFGRPVIEETQKTPPAETPNTQPVEESTEYSSVFSDESEPTRGRSSRR